MPKLIPKIIFLLFVVLIVADFLTYQLKINWPLPIWRQQWQTFSYSDNKLSKFIVTGTLEDGQTVSISMQHWFKSFVGFETSRYNEISRSYESVKPLAEYVCRQFNQEVIKGQRLKTVNISSAIWPKERGLRKSLKDVAKDQVRYYPHIMNQKCF